MSVICSVKCRWIKLFLLIALSFTLATACYQNNPQKTNASSQNTDSTKECQMVQHELGETCVPTNPQRTVILDEFYLIDTLSSLGIKPVGYTPCRVCISSDTLNKFVADALDLGDMDAPSLEKIASLKPDLILGLAWQKQFYRQLSEIAPTVMVEDPDLSGFKKTLRYLAVILNKKDIVRNILDKYDLKVKKFRKQFEEKLKTKTVSVIGVDATSFYASKLGSTIYSQVMLDMDIQFSPAHNTIKTNGFHPLSIEILPDWDADFLFVIRNYKRHAEDLNSLMQQPIWSKLSAVKNGKVHSIILDVWGPITANQFIDDLYKYFADELKPNS